VGVPYRQLVRLPVLMEAFVLFTVVWTWAAAVGRHRDYARRFPGRYRLLRFEELVAAPEATLADLCQFVGVELEPRMLEQKVTSKGALDGAVGFDAAAADRWRLEIRPRARWLIERLLGRRLAEMGYR
jgi:hypothetical protein